MFSSKKLVLALLLFLPTLADAACTLNGSVQLPTGSTAASPAFTVTSSVGNAYACSIGGDSTVTVTAVSFSGQAATVVAGGTATAGNTFAAYKLSATTGITTVTVTRTGGSGSGHGVIAACYDLTCGGGGAFDNNASTNSTTSANPAPVLTVAAGGFAMSLVMGNNNISAVASPFTFDTTSTTNITNFSGGAHDASAGGGSLTSTYTMTSALWSAIIWSLKPAAAASCVQNLGLLHVGSCG
jgi:hypothetical protein